MGLVPVQGDPFAAPGAAPLGTADAAPPASGSLVPVAHDPFADATPGASRFDPALFANAPGQEGLQSALDAAAKRAAPAPSWTDIPAQALKNAPASAWNFATSIAQPFLHPVQTVQSFGDLAAGLGSKAVDAIINALPEDKRQAVLSNPDVAAGADANKTAMAKVDAVAGYFTDRYGSIDNFKKSLASDPVGVFADIATVLTGGEAAAARVPGVVGDIAKTAGTVGRVIDPLTNAGKAVSTVARGVGNAAAVPLSVTTGVSPKVITTAGRAGLEGNQAFAGAMRGTADINEPVAMAERAVQKMGADRAAAYKANMAATRQSPAVLRFDEVNKAVQAAEASTKFNGVAKSEEASAVVGKITDKVNEWQAAAKTDPAFLSPEGFDALKQAVGEIRLSTEAGSLARNTADAVYNAIKGTIVAQAPDYAKAMADYSEASQKLTELRKTFSLSPNATNDTKLRKLQSLMRDNVNTNYGARTKLGNELAKYEPNLPYALAGQSASSVLPRGLQRALAAPEGIGLIAAALTNPATAMAGIPMLAAMSPRLVAEAAYLGGRGLNGVQRGFGAVGPAASRAAYQFGRIPELQTAAG